MSRARLTRPPSEPPPDTNGFQLSGDDYENIWLRVKDRGKTTFWGFLSLALAICTVIGGVGGYAIAQSALEKEVERYTKTDEFRASLVTYARQQIPELQQALGALEQREQSLAATIERHREQIAAMARPPIEIGDQSIRWTATNGQSVRMLTGQVHAGTMTPGRVEFDPPFASPPIVLATASSGQFSGIRGGVRTEVTAEGFGVLSEVFDGSVHWIAIGH